MMRQVKALAGESIDENPEAAEAIEAHAAFWLVVKQFIQVEQVRVVQIVAAFEVGADGDNPKRGDGQGHPEAWCSFRMVHLGCLPLPAAPLVALEALLTPGA